jgi:hypothetical protein
MPKKKPKEKEPEYLPKYPKADVNKTEEAFKKVWAARHK